MKSHEELRKAVNTDLVEFGTNKQTRTHRDRQTELAASHRNASESAEECHNGEPLGA